MAKIKNTPYGWEFDVWCNDCKKVITVEKKPILENNIQCFVLFVHRVNERFDLMELWDIH